MKTWKNESGWNWYVRYWPTIREGHARLSDEDKDAPPERQDVFVAGFARPLRTEGTEHAEDKS